TETLVEDLIKKDGKIVGVRTGRADGDLYADCIIAADGVNSQISQKAGLRPEIKPDQVATAVKEIIALPKETIRNRFNLPKHMGATIEFIGKTSKGMVGVGFIYTNKESLSVGIGCLAEDFVKYGVKPYELLDEIKKHPLIAPLIEGGETKEYLAHLIPEGGYNAIPPLYTDGMLVVGDAAMLVNGLHREGSNLAIESGRLAAQTVIEAKAKNDFSKASLSSYKKKMYNSFIIKDLKKYSNATTLLEKNRQFINLYPDLVSDSAKEFLTVDGVSKRDKEWKIIWSLIRRRGIFGLIWDAITGLRMFE
ncbi:MAG: FAD-dependent oxidoreductase, partial [bacterium]